MAERKQKRAAPAPRNSARRRPARKQAPSFRLPSFFKPKQVDFKPDSQGTHPLKLLHMTQAQRDTYLRWGLYVATIVGLLMIQDVIMSQVTIFGATTDLAVCAILLITIMEGTEVGSLFVLIASLLYYFAGTSPGPYSVALLTFTGIGACIFRQMYWHRSRSSMVLCGGLALLVYEMGTFGVGIFLGLTRWDRMGSFLVTALLSWIVMIPLYSLINAIGQIGGHTWKE